MKIKKTVIAIASAVLVAVAACIIGISAAKKAGPRETVKVEGTNIESEELSWYKGSEKIVGKIFRPSTGAAASKYPCIIICNDLAETATDKHELGKALASKGFAAYCFDFRGGSRNALSDGKTVNLTLGSEIDDLKTVVAGLKKERNIDSERIYVIAYGVGAIAAAQYLSPSKCPVSAALFVSPSLNVADLMKAYYDGKFPEQAEIGTMTLSGKFLKELSKINPAKLMRNVSKPSMVLQGRNSDKVPSAYAASACENAENVELKLLAEGNEISISSIVSEAVSLF